MMFKIFPPALGAARSQVARTPSGQRLPPPLRPEAGMRGTRMPTPHRPSPTFPLSHFLTFFRLAVPAALLICLTACRTIGVLPPVDLSEAGWTVRQGQALWQPRTGAPEIAGEILLATHPDGRQFVQFTKNPFPLVSVQTSTN